MRTFLLALALVVCVSAGVYHKDAAPGNSVAWNGVMYWDIDPGLENRRADIEEAVRIIEANTVFRLPERKDDSAVSDWVRLREGNGCTSFVGKIRNNSFQYVTLAAQCSVGSIIHELMHAMGVHHEHVRGDRNEYMKVTETCANNYNYRQNKALYKDFGPYDLSSLMHYRAAPPGAEGPCLLAVSNADWGLTGRRTTPSPDSGVLMSAGDIALVNFLAGEDPPPPVCPVCQNGAPCVNGRCLCPDGYRGVVCSEKVCPGCPVCPECPAPVCPNQVQCQRLVELSASVMRVLSGVAIPRPLDVNSSAPIDD